MQDCTKDCRSKCWADYMDDKNSIFGKLIFTYVISVFLLSSYLMICYSREIIKYLEIKNIYWLVFFIKKMDSFRKLVFAYIIISYLLCYFKDPGYIPENIEIPKEIENNDFKKFCQKCNNWKPPRAHHCRRCNKCVFKMDHHCYFINNCVGVRNQKVYILFLIAILVYFLIFFFNSILGSIVIFKFKLYLKTPLRFVLQEFLDIFCLLQGAYFFPYVFNLLKKSIEVVFYNRTEVEIKKEIRGAKLDKDNAFKKIFGMNKYFYLYPDFPINSSNYLENIYPISDNSNQSENINYLITNKYIVH